MALAPIKELRKDELIWLSTHRCRHSHSYLNHYSCYIEENPQHHAVGFLDIEASNLSATFGIVYTYCIKELDGELIKRSITIDDLYNGVYDKRLMEQFCEDTKRFIRLVTHYGGDHRFDLPFVRTRAVKWNLPFPEHKFCFQSDTWVIARNKFKFHSNRLETICDFFGIPSKKHKMNPDVWLKMITGNPKVMQEALDYILVHNVEDVLSLEALWKKISKYSNVAKASI